MTDEKRRYTKKVRAELEEETRRRITESAMELHGTLGPSRTSVSAVAERAGVRRSTVYRHFPDEATLFEACSSHWSALNPPPDPARWINIEDPDERTRKALGDLYAFYARVEQMLANLLRDEATMPVIRERFAAYHLYLEAIRDQLLSGRGLRGRARTRAQAAIGHALAFSTWRSLVRDQGMRGEEAANLMAMLIMAGCESPPRPTTPSGRQSS
jgi:AcrR family transcriptional regulator